VTLGTAASVQLVAPGAPEDSAELALSGARETVDVAEMVAQAVTLVAAEAAAAERASASLSHMRTMLPRMATRRVCGKAFVSKSLATPGRVDVAGSLPVNLAVPATQDRSQISRS
jgi:hypothetical protein